MQNKFRERCMIEAFLSKERKKERGTQKEKKKDPRTEKK